LTYGQEDLEINQSRYNDYKGAINTGGIDLLDIWEFTWSLHTTRCNCKGATYISYK